MTRLFFPSRIIAFDSSKMAVNGSATNAGGTEDNKLNSATAPESTVRNGLKEPSHDQLLNAAHAQLLYELSLLYYKKNVTLLDYESKVNLSALYKQATFGQ